MCSDGGCNGDSKKTISNKMTFFTSFYVWWFLDSYGIQTESGYKDPNKTESVCVQITTILLNRKDKLIKMCVCVCARTCELAIVPFPSLSAQMQGSVFSPLLKKGGFI